MISIVENCAVWACKPLRRNLKISYGLRFGTPIRVCYLERGIPYQVKQRAGDRGITAENMEKWQHANFNEDTINETASVACSNVRLWKLHGLSERMKKHVLTPLRWKAEIDSAGFIDSKENKWVCS